MKIQHGIKGDTLTVYHRDLSIKTLRKIQHDLSKYAHLKAYAKFYSDLGQVIIKRRDFEEAETPHREVTT